jgi:hypothetical protein
MSGPHSNIKYTGSTPGADASTYVLFATILPAAPTNAMNANWGESAFAHMGVRKFSVLIDHVQAGTLNAYESIDRGVTWRQIDTVAVAAPAAASSTSVDFQVEGLRDFKLEWVNGGVAQNPWEVLQSLSDQRASTL